MHNDDLAKVLYYYGYNIDSDVFKIICPFHEDVNPSMIVDLNEGRWFCFGCGLSGDALKFVKLIEKKNGQLNDLQCYKKYLKIINSNDRQVLNLKIRKKEKRTKKELYAQAYDYYHGLRKINWFKLDEDTKKVYDYMQQRGFDKNTLKVKAKITYNESYPIVFPMIDNGKFKGWVCRTNNPEIEKKRKYLYNEGFSRSTTLVGSYGSKDYVIVVEGYMDRLKFIKYGEDNVVAILGWKMSDGQIEKLKSKGITKIISALDNDDCGKKGTKHLEKFFKVTRFCYLKNLKDPGDMNEMQFKKMINKTMVKFKEENKKWD